MTRKKIITVLSPFACIAVISVLFAVSFGGSKGPDFTGKNPEEIKAYFKSEAFQSLDEKDRRAVKKKAYAPMYQQQEQAFIEQAKTYAQLPPQQKVTYLDRMIEQIVRDAETKQRETQRIASRQMQGSKAKGGDDKKAKLSYAKKTSWPENIRAWSEKMEPEKRAYIMGLKEALRKRMEQRGIEMP